jgi:hypothetical protein
MGRGGDGLQPVGGRVRRVLGAGLLRESLRSSTPLLLYAHGRASWIGSFPIGTLTVIENHASGLWVAGELLDCPLVDNGNGAGHVAVAITAALNALGFE